MSLLSILIWLNSIVVDVFLFVSPFSLTILFLSLSPWRPDNFNLAFVFESRVLLHFAVSVVNILHESLFFVFIKTNLHSNLLTANKIIKSNLTDRRFNSIGSDSANNNTKTFRVAGRLSELVAIGSINFSCLNSNIILERNKKKTSNSKMLKPMLIVFVVNRRALSLSSRIGIS